MYTAIKNDLMKINPKHVADTLMTTKSVQWTVVSNGLYHLATAKRLAIFTS